MTKNVGAFIFALLVFSSILVFYTAYDKVSMAIVPGKLVSVLVFKDFSASLSELNKAAALAGLGLISLAFLVGPLSRMFPKKFAWLLAYRKPVGLLGFGFAFLHSAYALIVTYGLDFDKMLFSNPKALGFVSAVIALSIFLFMTVTSTPQAVKKMGYKNWKTLQTSGYVALFFAVLHFVILETKPLKGLDVRPFALVFLVLAIIALALRAGLLLAKQAEPKSFEDHMGSSEK